MPPLRQLLKHPGTYLLIFGLLGALAVADTLRAPGAQWTARAYDFALRGYQAQISPHLARHVRCRFVPSCSQYSREVVAKLGLWRGLRLTVDRVRRCRPDVPMGTVDPVDRTRVSNQETVK